MKTPRTKKKVEPAKDAPYIAGVLIRTLIGRHPDIQKTLKLLKLEKRMVCVVLKNTPQNHGMLKKVKDLVAFGEIDDATFKELQTKRGKKSVDSKGNEKTNTRFNLHPPRGGFERKGIKIDYISGGALGYRGAAMKALITKMV